ncbi:MAG TPA: TerY-C metal binding domain-containing protein [Arenimonas sp.]|nr:TerY-C metal binding domain-containing protein [Arenimonas sp.]
MRRLPIYFLLDVSESMVGENHRKLQRGMESIVQELRRDPHALETVYLSAIAFAGKVKTIAPLVELVSFYPPQLPLGSGTSLGQALFHLMAEIDRNTVKTTAEQKGDWKPIVFLLTDGKPTDNFASAVRKWKDGYRNKASLIAVALGRYADLKVLKDLADEVLILEKTSDDAYKKFIAWVTASVSSQSKSVGSGGGDRLALASIDKTVLQMVDDVKKFDAFDPDSVILVGRCQKKKLPYIMKYEKNPQEISGEDFRIDLSYFDFSGCFPLDEDYFTWSDESSITSQTVNTALLRGAPGCPHCGARIAFAMCSCGGILCINEPGKASCPWCECDVNFSAEGGGDFDVSRARG